MGEESRNVLLQACSIDRAFHAQHPLVDLDLITDMATADHPAWSPAEGGIQKGAGEGIKSAEVTELSRTPGATDLSPDIKARPSEHRYGRRQVNGRRRRRPEVGRESRSS